jgi:sulfofructose kinase
MPQFDIVGLGVSVVDILQLVDHFPSAEEVQRAHEMTIQGGGPVATAMVTLARLGARVAMVDGVGDDWRGALIRDEFQREGVCTDYIRLRKGRSSSLACILVAMGDGARTIVYAPGDVPELSVREVPRSVIESAGYLHVNGRHWEACLQACRWARNAGVRVSMDGGASRFRPELRSLVPLADICIVARDFAARYAGKEDIARAARTLLDEGPHIVVVTDGVKGSWVYSAEGHAFHQPAHLLPRVVDTTGCGDSYHGAFLYGLLREMPLEKTASFASAVAALNSQRLGGREGLPTLEQVMAFLSRV